MLSHVAIVGAGFSGTLQAINLLRHEGPRATLIERSARAGVGLAYAAADPGHLLNVRAANMSALPDDPGHFVRWLAANGQGQCAGEFVPRLTYGAYLRALLEDACKAQPGRLTIVEGDACRLDVNRGVDILLADGRRIAADAAVLAVGNLPPHHPQGLSDSLSRDLYASDPWDRRATAGLDDSDELLILGTGLTMVDMVLKLDAEEFGGHIVALSRRGLLPHRHNDQPVFTPIEVRPEPRASALLAAVRERAAHIEWRNAVDELRRFTTPLWRAADEAARGRFLPHLRPWWDIHRHRIAPSVAACIADLVSKRRLEVVAAKTIAFKPNGSGLLATYRLRGQDVPTTHNLRRAINCTGPQSDLLASREPLLADLVANGVIRPDALHIGIDVDARSRAIAADGRANDRLFVIGPLTRGESWEIVAVPDIRMQVWSLARHMANAHWVGGEGL